MNKKTIIVILSVLVVLIGIFYYQKYYKSGAILDVSEIPIIGPGIQSILPVQKKPLAPAKQVLRTHVINLKETGPEPRYLDISSGDTVKFENNGTRPFWVASDPHPIHNLCPGFDSSHGLVHSESWSHTFNFDAPRVCSYHNHVDVTTGWYKGTINIVK